MQPPTQNRPPIPRAPADAVPRIDPPSRSTSVASCGSSGRPDATSIPIGDGQHPRAAAWSATLYGALSALGYMAANICLRQAAALDPIWVSQMKSVPLIVCTAPFLVRRMALSQSLAPGRNVWLTFAGAAAIGQLGGNVLFQWSLGVIGLALAVPLSMGTQIIAGGLLGHWLLRDLVSRTQLLSSALMITAIAVLSCGANAAHTSVTQQLAADWREGVAGVLAACISGVAYSCLSVAVRSVTRRGLPTMTLLFTSGTAGFLLLGGLVAMRQGLAPWAETSTQEFFVLAGAGIFNLLAFTALTKALHASSVVFVNALSASQIALAALSGVLLFREAFTPTMALGVALTVAGLLVMRPQPKPPVVPAPPLPESLLS